MNPLRVKIFTVGDVDSGRTLEMSINEWLEKNHKSIEVVFVKQSESDSECDYSLTVSVWYREL